MNRFALAVSSAIARITGAALGPYQTAVVRIGFSATWLLFLLREIPHREELYGPGSPWSWDLAQQLISSNSAFTALMWSDTRGWFEVVYVLAALSSLLLLLGWRTRTMSVLFMIGVLSLQNRSVFMGDGGDNVLHLMSVYLVFTRCGQVWSLDARRARLAREARARGQYVSDQHGRDQYGPDVYGPEQYVSDQYVSDRVGPALWGLLGFALVAVTMRQPVRRRRPDRAGDPVGRVARLRPVVGREAPGEERRAPDTAGRHSQHRPQRRPLRDHGRGLSDLRDSRIGTRSRARAGRTAPRSTTPSTWTTSRPGPGSPTCCPPAARW